MDEKKSRRGIQSIEIAGRILNAMSQTLHPLMLKDISLATDIPPGQLHAYLVSLRVTGLVDQDESTGRYQIGRFALTLGLARMRSFDPLRKAATLGYELALKLKVIITISIWDGSRPVILQVHRGAADIHVQLVPGGTYHLLNSAAGQLFAALLPDSTVAPLITQELNMGYRTAPSHAIKDLNQWMSHAITIRERGYSVMENSPFEGLHALSCPVFDSSKNLQFTMTAIGLSWNFNTNDKANEIIESCREISSELGYTE